MFLRSYPYLRKFAPFEGSYVLKPMAEIATLGNCSQNYSIFWELNDVVRLRYSLNSRFVIRGIAVLKKLKPDIVAFFIIIFTFRKIF